MKDIIYREDAIGAVSKACEELRGCFARCEDAIKALPSAQPELIEQGAYVRGFEQGRTQGMIDNTIKAEWTNADALDLQPTCNRLATDCISRQEAQDLLDRVGAMHPYRQIGNRESYRTYNEAWTDAINMADAELNSLLSVQPEGIKNVELSEEDYEKMTERMRKSSLILTSADPERKTGKWISMMEGNAYRDKCNQCLKAYPNAYGYNFCPNCGTKMEGK